MQCSRCQGAVGAAKAVDSPRLTADRKRANILFSGPWTRFVPFLKGPRRLASQCHLG
jgi:hypothetical protein